jgi:tol-pal system protein YbgF
MRRFPYLVLAAASGIGAASCALPQQVELIEREQRRLRTEAVEVSSQYKSLQDEVEAIRSTLADSLVGHQGLQREVVALRERVDEVDQLTERRAGETARDLDQRMKTLETKLEGLTMELKSLAEKIKIREDKAHALEQFFKSRGTDPADPSVVAGAPDQKAGDSEKKEYDNTLKLIDQKNYQVAIGQLRDFIKRYPKSEYADNAQYWIGESFYALREFDQAILEFDAVRRNYPKGDKVPAALLKQGFAFAELGDRVDARLILREVVERYPQSEEAAKAQQKLKSLES